MTVKMISAAAETDNLCARPLPQVRPRILVAEDDRDIRRLNTELLMTSGYQVDAAEDGAAAWDLLQANRYDLLVTDHSMPKVTGLELVQKLYQTRRVMPVILATGASIQDQLNRTPGLQIEAVLLKPYTFGELLDLVENVLRIATTSREQFRLPSGGQTQPRSRRLPA